MTLGTSQCRFKCLVGRQGYAAYYITRLSFTFVAPVMRVEAGLDLTKMGVVLTIFPLAYACSKFLGGILGTSGVHYRSCCPWRC